MNIIARCRISFWLVGRKKSLRVFLTAATLFGPALRYRRMKAPIDGKVSKSPESYLNAVFT
jgi:hypothetical protein